MDKPKCRLCGEKHYATEPHVFSDQATKPRQRKAKTDDTVTPAASDTVTEGGLLIHRHCPTCSCGGKKVYASHAERQRAYRNRRKPEGAGAAG